MDVHGAARPERTNPCSNHSLFFSTCGTRSLVQLPAKRKHWQEYRAVLKEEAGKKLIIIAPNQKMSLMAAASLLLFCSSLPIVSVCFLQDDC